MRFLFFLKIIWYYKFQEKQLGSSKVTTYPCFLGLASMGCNLFERACRAGGRETRVSLVAAGRYWCTNGAFWRCRGGPASALLLPKHYKTGISGIFASRDFGRKRPIWRSWIESILHAEIESKLRPQEKGDTSSTSASEKKERKKQSLKNICPRVCAASGDPRVEGCVDFSFFDPKCGADFSSDIL